MPAAFVATLLQGEAVLRFPYDDRIRLWLRAIPGTPAHDPSGDVKAYVIGLGELYVSDPRFAANYRGGEGGEGATLVRDALRLYAEANL